MSASGNNALSANGLGRRFGRNWALAHVDLEVEVGESLLLAGANGSGKTTLLRLISGRLRQTTGQVSVFGERRARAERARLVTLVSHHSYLYAQLTALETVRLWSNLAGEDEADSSLLRLLESVRLDRRAHDRVGTFSAGMRKRLTLLRTYLERPQLILLDEPFAALDPAGQQLISEWVRSFTERGATVMMASHALARACGLCRRAVLLERGQIRWIGPADAVQDQMHSPAETSV